MWLSRLRVPGRGLRNEICKIICLYTLITCIQYYNNRNVETHFRVSHALLCCFLPVSSVTPMLLQEWPGTTNSGCMCSNMAATLTKLLAERKFMLNFCQASKENRSVEKKNGTCKTWENSTIKPAINKKKFNYLLRCHPNPVYSFSDIWPCVKGGAPIGASITDGMNPSLRLGLVLAVMQAIRGSGLHINIC